MSVFNLPDLGEGLPDAEIVKWLVKEGDQVEPDQVLAEMETAKAVVEVPSPQKGLITKLHGKPGDIIKTGTPLVSFDGTHETPAQQQPKQTTTSRQDAATLNPQQSNSLVFNLPDLGEGLQEAEIVEWKIQLGDHIDKDQVIASMETAKAVVDLPAPFSGTVSKLHGQAGDIIKTGAALLEVTHENAAENLSETTNHGGVVGDLKSTSGILDEKRIIDGDYKATPAVAALARKLDTDLAQVAAHFNTDNISLANVYAFHQAQQNTTHINTPQDFTALKIGPAARNLANKLGVDIQQIRPTGPKGFITVNDVQIESQRTPSSPALYSDNKTKAAPKIRATARQLNIDLSKITGTGHLGNITLQDLFNAQTEKPSQTIPPLNLEGLNVERAPIRGSRRAMFSSMSQARDRVMNTTIFDDANVSQWQDKQDITMRFVRAITAACKHEPKLNAWLDEAEQAVVLHKDVNLGIAVDSENGLYVPVIKQADQKNALEIREELNQHRESINERNIKPEHLQGGSITLSNFGMIAGRYATPIVAPPQVAIIATGGFYDSFKLTEKQKVISQRMLPLSLSFDHRAVTGGEAARFLKALIEDLSKAN